jgi:predicted NAD/FAD-binding protein
MSEPNAKPVVVSLNVEGFAQAESETYEIPRDEWNTMTSAERLRAVEDAASDFAGNYVGWGWHIEDPDDYAAATGGAE